NDVKYEEGELKAIGYRKGVQVMQEKMETTGEPYAFKIETDKTALQSDNRDVVHLTISVVDKNGLPVPNANTTFNLKLSGDAKLLGIDNGDPLFVGDFKQTDNRVLFNGLALAILQSTRKQGVVDVEVSGENIRTATVKLQVE
ncbi:MAG: hypothetical protein VB102_11425, partial [Paludibacter sp.]|nr:hypothetical protein [Paludibacter sp.]